MPENRPNGETVGPPEMALAILDFPLTVPSAFSLST